MIQLIKQTVICFLELNGLIGLVATGLTIYDKWQKSKQTFEEKAFDSLIKKVFVTAEELLKEIRTEFLNNTNHSYYNKDDDDRVDKKNYHLVKEIKIDYLNRDKKAKLLADLLSSFEVNNDTHSIEELHSILDMPAIDSFKSLIMRHLQENYNNYENRIILDYFDKNFKPTLEFIIREDKDLRNFRELIKAREKHTELEKYLKFVIEEYQRDFADSEKDYRDNSDKDIDFKFVSSQSTTYQKPHYISDRKAIELSIGKWDISEKEIEIKYSSDIDNVDFLIKDFIENESKKYTHYLVIGASFGIGKTSLIKRIAATYAKRCNARNSEYVPIIVYLKNGLDKVYHQMTLEQILEIIVPLSNSQTSTEKYERKILLIVDGMDEYRGNEGIINLILKYKKNIFEKYKNIKVILTTRLIAGLPDELRNPLNESYIRLLPFEESQVNEYLRYNKVEITYSLLREMGLGEEIRKPLLLMMLCKIMPKIKDDLKQIQTNDSLPRNTLKSIIYLNFFHYIIEGKYYKSDLKDYERKALKEKYIYEKKIVKMIALLKQLHKIPLTEDMIEKELESVLFDDSFIQKKDNIFPSLSPSGSNTNLISPIISKLEPILTAYFRLSSSEGKNIIEFLHESYKEYLMAENYIEGLLSNDWKKLNYLNAGLPSEATIQFLQGLLNMFKSKDENLINHILNKKDSEHGDFNIYDNKINLLYSFGLKDIKSIDLARQKIIENAIACINYEGIILFNPIKWEHKNNNNDSGNVNRQRNNNFWINSDVDIYSNDYNNLWISRWISLFVLNTLETSNSNKIDKLKLERLVRSADTLNGNYLKNLQNCDLSKFDLHNANLTSANLSNANLTSANLSNANLSYTNLSDSNLSSANLSNANLTSANLSNANLSNANLDSANLSDAKIAFVNLSSAYLPSANLSSANLSSANLSSARLLGSNLAHANLSYTRLKSANLYNANLSGAILSDTVLAYANLASTNLNNANLSSANLSSANLSSANLTFANLTFANLTFANLSGANLSKANLLNVKIENAILLNLNDSKIKGLVINEKISFTGVITDSKYVINYLENIITKEHLPILFSKRDDLKVELQNRRYSKTTIDHILSLSIL